MKKNVNLKVHNKWKNFAFLLLLIGMGCKNHTYKNVFLGVQESDTTKEFAPRYILIRDVETGVERIVVCKWREQPNFTFGYSPDLSFYEIGDTITIRFGGIYSDHYYTDNKILNEEDVGIYNDSINVRSERAKWNNLRQKFNSEK